MDASMKGLLLTCLMLLNSSSDWKPVQAEDIYGKWVSESPILGFRRLYLYFSIDVPILIESLVDERNCNLDYTFIRHYRFLGNGRMDTYTLWEGKVEVEKYVITMSPDSRQIKISSFPAVYYQKAVLAKTTVLYERVEGR